MDTTERVGERVAETITERVARERDYHNQRFADDSGREARTRRFYDAISYGFALYRQRVSESSRGRRVLEYGCGTESLAFDLSHIASQVVGIDISDVAIAQAHRILDERGLANVEFVVDNAEAMQLPDSSVDVVAGSGIVHHLDIPKSMRELRRVLRDGGIAIFAEPMGHNPIINWYRNRTPELRTPDEHPLLARDLRFMGRKFKSMKVTYFGMIAPILGFMSMKISPDSLLTRFVWWLDRVLCRVPLLNRYAWFCLVELRT
jgi:ubiquinone/menaquinone biosynthesis C-methylase UbiE